MNKEGDPSEMDCPFFIHSKKQREADPLDQLLFVLVYIYFIDF